MCFLTLSLSLKLQIQTHFQFGLDEEDGDHEDYLEEIEEDSEEDEDEDEEDEEGAEDEDESEEEEEEVEAGRIKLLSHPLPDGSKGSMITCCPSILRGSCTLDRHLPRLPCGHFAIPTRDVAIQGTTFSSLVHHF